MWVNFRLAAAAGNRSQEVLKMLEKYDFGAIPENFNLPPKPFFLAHPETGDPLDAGGMFMVTLGLIEPEGLGEAHISAKEAQELSRCLSRKAQAWILANKLILSDGVAKILERYASTEEHKRLLLKNVIFEIQTYTEDQLTEELPAIAGLLSLFDDTEVSEDDVVFHLYKASRQ